jgi:hypothetical protein
VTVTGVDDDVDDGDRLYTIELAAAVSTDGLYGGIDPADVAVTNIDDDTAGFVVSAISGDTTEVGGSATFTVSLTSEPLFDVTINMNSSDPTEGRVQPNDPTSLTFSPSDWNIDQTVTVKGIDDDVSDGDQNYDIVLTSVSLDALYDGLDPADVKDVLNIDDDSPGFLVGTASGDTTESGGTASFTVTLNTQPTADVSVAVSSSNTLEGTVNPLILTFTPGIWNSPQTVTVTGVNDDVDDGDRSYVIVLDAATSGDADYDGLDPSDVAVTNVDDDTAGFAVGIISGDTTEAGAGTATFTVKLRSEPVDNVRIDVSSSDISEGMVDKASLTFTDTDWNLDQTVTVTGVDDDVADGDQNFSIELAAAVSSDSNYAGKDPGDLSVTNIDDEVLSLIASCSDAGSVECLERTDGGDDGSNLGSAPRIDFDYEFMIDVQDNSGTPPNVRLRMAQGSDPLVLEFYSYDMTCAGDYLSGYSCSFVTRLGPAYSHKYYYEVESGNGAKTERYPLSGYLTGPTIHLLNGYNLVGIPRDTGASSLGGSAAFGTPNSYRWDGSLGYYTQVTTADPVQSGEGYFVAKATASLPQHDSLGEVQVTQYEYTLQSGWNIISNPYGCNVLLADVMVKQNGGISEVWDTAVANGWLSNAIYYYEGSDWGGVYDFETTFDNATLVPWVGYWVYVNDDTHTYTLVIRKP